MCACELSIWGDIANIVIAVASVVTAIVTAIVLCKQYCLQQAQLNTQQLEHQPVFNFKNTTKSLVITNTGDSMSSPAQIELHPLLIVELERYIPYSEESLSLICCLEYQKYKSYICTDNYNGVLFTCFKEPTNNGRFLFKQKEYLKNAIYPQITDDENLLKCNVRTFDLIKIKYKDRYKISRVVYYMGNNEISEECYNDFFDVIKNANSPIDINDLEHSDILNDVMCFERVMHSK